MRFALPAVVALLLALPAAAYAQQAEPDRRILVTYRDAGGVTIRHRAGAPHRARTRYRMKAAVRRHTSEIEREFGLVALDHWPIRSLEVYCFVYDVPRGTTRARVVDDLRADDRVESAQVLNEFNTGSAPERAYDDTYVGLQHGLAALNLSAAHRYARGRRVRIAVIDGDADRRHEDLRGQIAAVERFTGIKARTGASHGTAVTSVIAAAANNARGIVGVAPDSVLHLLVACWADDASPAATCNSFSLAKALDALVTEPPDVLNLSLTGPDDPLLRRLIAHLYQAGVVIVAAHPNGPVADAGFPASMSEVIAVGSADRPGPAPPPGTVFAPGLQILVAVPSDRYDFRSGNSLAAAHVTGVIALLLERAPDSGTERIRALLGEAQSRVAGSVRSVDACRLLWLNDESVLCAAAAPELLSERKLQTEHEP